MAAAQLVDGIVVVIAPLSGAMAQTAIGAHGVCTGVGISRSSR